MKIKINKLVVAMILGLVSTITSPVALGATGDLLGTVKLPDNGGCSVGGTMIPVNGEILYITTKTNGCAGTALGAYSPPAGGDGDATLVATKNVVDGVGASVYVSAVAWDPKRNLLWAAYSGSVYTIDLGDPSVDGDVEAVYQFSPTLGGLIDGLAYDEGRDTLWYSPDVNLSVYEYGLGDMHPLGDLLNTVSPKNADGVEDRNVSGVVVGTDNSLYIGRNGDAEIRRVDKDTGDFISQFATTAGRVEDLTCDPVTYQPLEAIVAKDAYSGLYEAFEVEEGTCPLPGTDVPVAVDIKPQSCRNPLNVSSKGVLPVAILGTEGFDVSMIDVSTISLEGVAPISSNMEDVATPFEPYIGKQDPYDCTTAGADGWMDLSLKFKKKDIVAALADVSDGDVLVLKLTANLKEEFGGGTIVGEDVIVILKK